MKVLRIIAAAAMVLMVAGCATRRINWETRIGSYNFDQAVAELGPPDKQAKLTDGTVVAEWLLRRGFRDVYPTAGYYSYGPYYHHRPFPPTYVESYSPDYYLRLIFRPDGQLKDWKNFSR